MSQIDQYVQKVMQNIHAPSAERERIESDLRSHLNEALAAGEPEDAILRRMGDPVEVAKEFMAQMALVYAGFWRRLAAYGIDLVVMIVIAGTLALVGVASAITVPRNPVGLDWVVGALLVALTISAALATIGTVLLYFPIQEGRFGQTLGKRWLRLWVLKEDGLPIGYKEAFLRRLSYYFDILPVDALFIPFTAKRQRAFDVVAHTVVVRESDDKGRRAVLALALVIALPLVLMFACVRPQSRLVSLSAPNPAGHAAYAFTNFTGSERADVQAASGRTLKLEYEAAVSSGSLSIRVEDAKGQVVWQMALPIDGASGRQRADVRVDQGERYAIVLEGREAGAKLDLSWSRR